LCFALIVDGFHRAIVYIMQTIKWEYG